MQRCAWFEPKLGPCIRSNSQHRLDPCRSHHLRMTKDVHEECIGAICAIQFFPLPIGANPRPLRGGVNFFEAPAPLWIATNFLIRSWVEVSMPAILVSPKDDAGDLPIRA